MDTKSKILGLKLTVPQEKVNVPGVGDVTVRGLTAAGRDSWEQRIFNSKGKTVRNIRASLVCLCLYENDSAIFTESDIEQLGELPAQVVDRLYDIASKLSGMTKDDKVVMEKNSESGPSDT